MCMQIVIEHSGSNSGDPGQTLHSAHAHKMDARQHVDDSKKKAHDSQIVWAKENLKTW